MPYPEGHKLKVRNRILTSAADAFRKNGIRESSVPSIMKGAGLTHGGFYSHFVNKEELVAETCYFVVSNTIDELRISARNEHSDTDEPEINRIIDFYLSSYHRDHAEKGCIVPILSGEIAQSSADLQEILSHALNQYIAFIGEISGSDETTSGVVLSIMVGSLLLARSVKDPVLSTNILNQAKEQAKAIFKSSPK